MAARTSDRIVLSKNPKENLDAAKKIYKKHLELGNESPLKFLKGVKWEETGPKIDSTLEEHTQAELHKDLMEKHYANRDVEMPGISKALRLSIKFLKASFGETPKDLADWGIQVDDSPKAKPKK